MIDQFVVLRLDLVQLSTSMNKVTTDYGEIPLLQKLMVTALSSQPMRKKLNLISKRKLKVALGNQDLLLSRESNVFQALLVKFTNSKILKNQQTFRDLGCIPPTLLLLHYKKAKLTRDSRRTMLYHFLSEMVKELNTHSVINQVITDTRDNQISLSLEIKLSPGNE